MQRKRRKKKRFGVFLFLLVVCIGIGIMFVPWAMQPENFREVKNKINGFLYKEDFPDSYNAKSLILVDCSDDEIFVSKNENEPQIPASLAKLFVIEYGKYDYEIKLVYDDQFADLQKLKKEKEAQSR